MQARSTYMKRIINGVTYNTDTATALAESEWEEDDDTHNETLHQTRGGAFFAHRKTEKAVWDERNERTVRKERHEFIPMSRDGAHKWMMEGEVTVWSNPFDDPPEAAAEAEPGATIYMRVPTSLKRRVDEAAREAKMSGNAWSMRCVERCVAGANAMPELARVWGLSSTFRAHNDDGDWTRDQAVDVLSEIADLIEALGRRLFGGEPFEGALMDPEVEELAKKVEPYRQ